MDWPLAHIDLIRLVVFSGAGICAAGLFTLLPNTNIAAVITLCFYVQIFIGFPPGDFALPFCTAATTALIINCRGNTYKKTDFSTKQNRLLLLFSVLASFLIIVFRHNISECVIFFKTSGLLLTIVLVLAINVLMSSTTVLKAIAALFIGLSAAIFGPLLAIELPFAPWNTINLNEGKNLVAVLTAAFILPPILAPLIVAHAPPSRPQAKLKTLEFLAILFLIVTGIGISPFSIVMLAILNSENVNFGAMTTYESPEITFSIITGTIIAVISSFILKNKHRLLVESLRKRSTTNNIQWIYISIIFIIFSSAVISSDLGIEIIYLSIFIGLFFTVVKTKGYPISLFLIGFIYGNKIVYMIDIISKTESSLPIKYVFIFLFILFAVLLFRLLIHRRNFTGNIFHK